MGKARALGRGLSSLIPHSERSLTPQETLPVDAKPKTVRLEDLKVNPYQPRRNFDQEALQMLAESIAEHGLIQPILVREIEGEFEIVAGERRWRASKLAGLIEVPVHVLELTDNQSMELALVENIQREDLSVLDVALGINELIKKFSFTHEQIAKKLGWSRASITNKLRLLQLPEKVMNLLIAGDLTEGHARALLAIADSEEMHRVAQLAVSEALSVRQVEEEIKRLAERGHSPRPISEDGPDEMDEREVKKIVLPSPFSTSTNRMLKKHKVKLKLTKDSTGSKISIQGLTDEQLDKLCQILEENIENVINS